MSYLPGSQASTWVSATAPTVNNDGVDTAAVGRSFLAGDFWINNVTKKLYVANSVATGAADWVTDQAILFSGYASLANTSAGEQVYPFDVIEVIPPAALMTVAANGNITIVSPGWYRFEYRSDAKLNGDMYVTLRKDGTSVATGMHHMAGEYYVTVALGHTEYLTAGQVLTFGLRVHTGTGQKWVAHTADQPGRVQILRG